MRVDIGGYTETGAGDISLRVQARKYDFVESGLGVKVARYFSHAGGSFVPELRARAGCMNSPTRSLRRLHRS